jgi:thiol-disulfide isomerase/thioredoxin
MIPGIKKLPFLFVILLFIFLLFFPGCTEEKNNTGDDFSFLTLDGETKHLSDFYGKVIVLDCMAVNCQPCMYQMFELKKISENYSNNDISLLSIASMLQDMIDAFKNQANLTVDWTFGLDDAQGTIENTYASEGVPTLYIYDKKGNIYYSHVGYESYTDLKIKIDEALIKN